MKIYIAAPWADRAKMPDIAKRFEAEGNEITHKWWEVENTPESDRTAKILEEQAIHDVDGVIRADLVVVLNTAKSEGKAFEQGVAIAHGKPIIIVGERGQFSQNVFHYLPQYKWVEDVEVALDILDTINWLVSVK